MFFLRPKASWQGPGTRQVKPATGFRGPFSLFSSLSPRQMSRLSAITNRRAVDALGVRSAPAAKGQPFFVNTGTANAATGRLVLEYSGDAWLSPEENQQMLELQDSADGLMSELTHAEQDLASLSAQTPYGAQPADLSLIAQQTFSRIDNLMQRWGLRAEQIEQTITPSAWVAFNPVTGARLAEPPALRRSGARGPAVPAAAAPTRATPASNRQDEQRRLSVRHELAARPVQTAGQIKQRRILLAERNAASGAEKVSALRQQMNQLAMAPMRMGKVRRIGLARLASLHDTIDHMAHSLYGHRQQVENSMHKSLDRRSGARAPKAQPLPAPVYKPKLKGETTG